MTTVQVPTSELVGEGLNYAVAKAVGKDVYAKEIWPSVVMVFTTDGFRFMPSADWSQAGPIIEQYSVKLAPYFDSNGERLKWYALTANDRSMVQACHEQVLVAAMQAIVMSHFGDTVEIPEELVK